MTKCLRRGDKMLRCWGHQPGTPNEHDHNFRLPEVKVAPEGLGPVIQFDNGGFSTCAVDEGGDVRCWGELIWPNGERAEKARPFKITL